VRRAEDGHLPSVDVVVNNFNYARFLPAAIESALAQTHPAVRVVVVDDGSTDGSREVIASYGPRIAPVLKENGGQASALNAGFARSTGDIVIFLDADDILRSDAALLAAEAFRARPRAAKVQYRMEVIDEEGRPNGVVKPALHLPFPSGDLRLAELTFPFDLTWLATSGNAFSAAVLRRILPIPDTDFARCPDWYLVHLAPLFGEVVSLDAVGAFYRVHGANQYEPAVPALDLDHVRQTIRYAAVTRRALVRAAAELGLLDRGSEPLAVSDVANRLISLRLGPEGHPVAGDSRLGLARAGLRASTRRFDVPWQLKALFVLWFVAAASAPRPLVRRLAELFLFPERRRAANRLLGALHARRAAAGAEATG
jgi:glycosyltransferase involved in cell wall biosynthesis